MSLIRFANLAEYKEFTAKEWPTLKITKEDIERLNPDRIDNQAFWTEAQEKFGFNPICGAASEEATAENVNRWNYALHENLGCYCILRYDLSVGVFNSRINVIEVGGGLGSTYDFLTSATKAYGLEMGYTNLDLLKREKSYIPANDTVVVDGKDFSDLPGLSAEYVFCLNTFQHCTFRQHERYMEYFDKSLRSGGRLIISTLTADEGRVSFDGKAYVCHYGQYTPLRYRDEWINLADFYGFNVATVSRRYFDGFTCFSFVKR